MGALIFTSPTTLVVQTGDAGDPALAADPASLAGKVLRIEQPTTVNQAPQTTALTGMGAGGGHVHRPVGRLALHHRPHPDRRPAAAHHQGLEGLDGVDVARSSPAWRAAPRWTARCWSISSTPSRPWRCGWRRTPARSPASPRWSARTSTATRGRCSSSPDGNVWGATVNKTAGDAEKLDDVVFPLFPQGGGFPRSNADNT